MTMSILPQRRRTHRRRNPTTPRIHNSLIGRVRLLNVDPDYDYLSEQVREMMCRFHPLQKKGFDTGTIGHCHWHARYSAERRVVYIGLCQYDV